jgi:wyosine [tRNA(Phe)-imidazoG37] synthetase (radical SAM superfamily)
MANPNPPTTVSVTTFLGYAKMLHDMATQFEQLVERMESQGIQQISTINYPSGLKGRKMIETFLNAANSAFWQEVSKDPEVSLVREAKKKYSAKLADVKKSEEAIQAAEKALKKKLPKR